MLKVKLIEVKFDAARYTLFYLIGGTALQFVP